MVLFVKRTFAIKVSGTSRIEQSNEGGGAWKRICPSEVPGKAKQDQFGSRRDGRPMSILRDHSPTVNPDWLSSLN